MKPSTPNAVDNAYEEISFTLPKGHRLNQPRARSEYDCPKTSSKIKPDDLEMHGFRSKAAETLSRFKGVAWLLREIPNTGTGELELRIAVKGRFVEVVRSRIIKDLLAFQTGKIEGGVVTHRL